ncbi:M28 family peptidase, partial [Actinomycetes bacterium KLBMP 9797]
MAVTLLPRADRTLARPPHRVVAAGAAVAALLAVGAATLVDLRPPAPRGADTPPGEFSAARAYAHVRTVGAATHPAGSAANDRVREHLVDTLRGLGLNPEVQDTVGPEAGQLSGGAAGSAFARVRNVVARLPGSAPTGRVFLVAHYDSVQVGPGGNDDGAGVATILEVARALTSGPRPRNDVVFVLTDAEEACLCGAAAFVGSHPLAAGGGVALNLEARGSTGPVVMFETSRDNAALVGAYGRAAPHPIGTSFAVEVYRALPNDTDFTPFLDAGFAGLNAAYIDGAALYHTPLDTPATMNRASLQQHGDNALALAREFGAVNFATLTAGGDATYFPVPGGLVRYPGWLTWPLAGLALLATGALAWLARRRGLADRRRLAGGFGLALLPILAAPVAAQLLWVGLVAVRPGYAELTDLYRPLWFRCAVLALAAAVLFLWYALLRRRLGPAALVIGGLGWLAVLGMVLAALAPGGSYLATLPALAGAVAGFVAVALPRLAVPVLVAGAAVGVLILVPTVVLLFPALGLALGGVAALFAILLGLATLPILELIWPEAGGQRAMTAMRARRRAAYPALAAFLAALALAGAGLRADRFDAAYPAPSQLMYALDAGTGQALWLSEEASPQDWTAQYVSARRSVGAQFPLFGSTPLSTGPAPAAALPAPALDVLSSSTVGDQRTLRLRLRLRRPVRLVALHVDAATAAVASARVAGTPAPVSPAGEWAFGLVFHAPPAEGVELELVLRPTTGPVRFRVTDASDGLSRL